MNVVPTRLPGVILIEARIFRDSRGHFLESWNQKRYAEVGIPADLVQDNVSLSMGGVLRGLHYQHPHAQGKLVSVLQGEVWDVAVDIRRGSPTFGQWEGFSLTAEGGQQLYLPEGFAHGFVVTSDQAIFSYKCTDYYQPGAEGTVLWNDPDLAIEWPVREPILSDKDRAGQLLRNLPPERLPEIS